jgi:rsbT antagonist protein RsbS
LTSIQSDISDEHALMLQTDILQRMDQSRARGVVLDITSLDIVDSYMARILTETARMAQLMGGEVVITGMNPMVALTLVEMGRELLGVLTALTLQQGIDKIQDRLAILEGDRGEDSPDDANR